MFHSLSTAADSILCIIITLLSNDTGAFIYVNVFEYVFFIVHLIHSFIIIIKLV